MKKLLPRTAKNSHGFTLIELLVVVAIIAILVVVAISLYSGIQKRARDSRRQAEVDALAKSMEVYKNPTDSQYTYTITELSKDYPQPLNRPQDPKAASGGTTYCIALGASAVSPAVPGAGDITSWIASTCPGGYSAVPTNGDIIPASPARYSFTVCARLEATETAFCKSSLSN